MRLFPHIFIFVIGTIITLSSCKEKSVWEEFEGWRNANNDYFEAKSAELNSNGTYAYERIVPDWDRGSCILMKRLKKGSGTVNPLYTSYVDVMYKGRLYDGTPFDSTYSYVDSITTLKISSTVHGFTMALTNMVEGDSYEIIIPSYLGYQDKEKGIIKPYSTLVFGIKLVKIAAYEKPYQKE
ncbi:MAG: FKBP-type peptidyl-prolyl cis-trans isomerase [Bacteroidales bacterium]|nr:FKBP-type peptidyl-prolyl cis-trans isomerase [Bacteroidales bacterium]